MYVLFETVDYVDGTKSAQLCGTYNTFDDARSLMHSLYHDELSSDDAYDADWCEIRDDCAIVGGDGGFPRVMTWYVFDSDNAEQIVW